MELSRPYQVLLGLALVLAAAWFLLLKPGSSSSSGSGATAAPAAQTQPPFPAPTHGEALPGGLGHAVAKAHGAAGASDQANAAAGADPSSASATAPATSKPAATPSAAPAARIQIPAAAPPIGRSGAQVMVLLFYNRQSADDQAVRGELGAISTRHGAVVVRAVPLTQLFRYRSVLNGTPITQSPTVLVLSVRHEAQELTGLVDTANLQQAVRDALA